MEFIISTIGILVTIAVVVITYYLNKKANREHQLFMEKLRIYSSYLQIISDSTKSEIEQRKMGLINKLILVKQEIILFAPESIVKLIGEIEPIDFTTVNQSEEEKELKYSLYLQLLNLMREDLNRRNKKISEDILKNMLGGKI